MNAIPLRVVLAGLFAASALSACDRDADRTLGQKLDSAVSRTQTELAAAGHKTSEELAQAGDKTAWRSRMRVRRPASLWTTRAHRSKRRPRCADRSESPRRA